MNDMTIKHRTVYHLTSKKGFLELINSNSFQVSFLSGAVATALSSSISYDVLGNGTSATIIGLGAACMSGAINYGVGQWEDGRFSPKSLRSPAKSVSVPTPEVKVEPNDKVKDIVKPAKEKEKSVYEKGFGLTKALSEYNYSAGGGRICVAVAGYNDEAPMVTVYKIIPVIESAVFKDGNYIGIDLEKYLKEGGKLSTIIKRGVNLNVLQDLGDNLSRDLSLPKGQQITVDVNVGQGMGAVYLPKEEREWVYTKNHLDEVANDDSELPMFLGKGLDTDLVIVDLVDAPHVIIGGTTKSGKTVGILSILTAMAYSKSPERLRMTLIDPKRVGLPLLNDLPHINGKSITDMREALSVVNAMNDEMSRRYALMEELGVQDIKEYNERVATPLPYEVFVFEELSNGIKSKLPMLNDAGEPMKRTVGQEIESNLTPLTSAGRAAGIHCIFLTQRFSADLFDGELRDNVDMGICMRVGTGNASNMVIPGERGGKDLLGYGDMLTKISGWDSAVRTQGGGFEKDSDEVRELARMIKEKWQGSGEKEEEELIELSSLGFGD